jgi:hypothetical protein
MKTDDVMTVKYDVSSRTLIPDRSSIAFTHYEQEKSITRVDLMLNAYSYSETVTWRDLVLFFLMTAVLSVITVLFVISLLSMWIRHRYKRKRGFIPEDTRFRPLPIICFFLILEVFLTKEFLTALYNISPSEINSFKIVIGALILIIAFYGYRRKKNRFHRIIIYAAALLTGADVIDDNVHYCRCSAVYRSLYPALRELRKGRPARNIPDPDMDRAVCSSNLFPE